MLLRLLLISLASPALGIPASTTLSLVQGEVGFNQLTVTVDPDTPIPLPDTDTAVLTGMVTADFDIDPNAGTTSELTLRDGRAYASVMNFSKSFIGFGYNVTAQNLSTAISTNNPPGIVEESTGNFVASQHGFEIDNGTITGTALGDPVNITLSPSDPFVGAGSGTGNVSLTPSGTSGIYQQFSVVVTLPVSIADNFDASGTNVAITATGTLKAIGTVQVPLSEYLAWTLAEGITGADGQADANHDGIPNGIAWALGLGAFDNAQNHVLRCANGGYEIQLPPGGTAAPISIEGSDLASAFLPISGARVSNTMNPLPTGTTGLISINHLDGQFLRLKVNE